MQSEKKKKKLNDIFKAKQCNEGPHTDPVLAILHRYSQSLPCGMFEVEYPVT